MLQKWQTLDSQLVFDHKWYKVRRDTVRLPSGAIVDDYFVSVRSHIALILPITDQQEIVFVRQYRHGVQEILLELPAGAFDPQVEAAETAARRELHEETGYLADRLLPLAILYDNPVKDTNQIHLFMAQELQQTGQRSLDLTEEIEVVTLPIDAILPAILQGHICVSGTIAALFLGLQSLGYPLGGNGKSMGDVMAI